MSIYTVCLFFKLTILFSQVLGLILGVPTPQTEPLPPDFNEDAFGRIER